MSGIINRVGARSGIISAGSTSTGTVTLSGTTGLDYEEGTWVALDNTDTALGSQSPALEYTKVGRIVTIQMDATWTSDTSATLKGLPFTCIAQHHGSAFAFTTSGGVRSLLIGANTTNGTIYAQLDAPTNPATYRFIGSFVYQSV